MGRTQRKTSKYVELYRKKLKKKALIVVSFTPPDSSKKDFIKLFSEVYPDDLVSIEKHFLFYQEKNKNRTKGNPLYFPHPSDLLYDLAKPKLRKLKINEWNSSKAEVDKMLALAGEKRDREKRQLEYRSNNISTQIVTPRYIGELIKRYWRENLKIRRLLIVIECSKFKNESTTLFFRQVLNGEKDWFIRNYCFRTLQRFDEVVYLSPKGKGKREQYDSLVKFFGCDYKEDIGRTPEDIMKEFYSDEYIEHSKDFDVFISHAISNADLVEDLVYQLNASGLVAFVDWKNDRQDLNRAKSSFYTAKVLELRMKQSKCLILIRTKESDSSTWVSWEVDYFTALKKKLAILNVNDDYEKTPKYINIYPTAKFIDEELFIFSSEKKKSVIEWVTEE
ncbi:toll/interleukin-1 receptor domain-containing protein [Aeromonas sobria]|nr:toll/interleukin-1 receptor domain-containing protein [Aeromonas sobria]